MSREHDGRWAEALDQLRQLRELVVHMQSIVTTKGQEQHKRSVRIAHVAQSLSDSRHYRKRASANNEADVLGTRQLVRRTVVQRNCRGPPAHNNRDAASCSTKNREACPYQVSIRTPDT